MFGIYVLILIFFIYTASKPNIIKFSTMNLYFTATSAAIKELEEINRHFQENNENEKLSKSENVNEIKSVQRNDDVDCLDEIQKQLEIQAIDTANPVHDDHDDDSQLKLDNATDQLQISSDDKQLQNDSSSQQ